ncbi:MAG: RnfABCDGE type electron transport complex subunit C [Bacteroides sp.]|jgi:electron transport complex protein RnfC|nr:RnfABCDGE type electron transport complex subunit C [Bacteroides sp.]MCI1681648.1 RnfABCDGE type electron transport complex subunit C [Bacteroides sp.]
MKLLIRSPKKENKQLTIKALAPVSLYRLSLKVFGGVMQPVVKEGERVLKQQEIARFTGAFPTRLHAPVSGTVEHIDFASDPCMIIRNDYEEEVAELPDYDPEQLTAGEILQRIADAGIVGNGGARFPTHLKYRLATEKQIEYFIVNGTECEPFLTADYAVMHEHTRQVVQGIACAQRVIGAVKIVITLEQQNRELKPLFEHCLADYDLPVRVRLLPDTYPQGGELQLIKSVTGMELRKGTIPADRGVVVSNVGTLWAVYRAIYERQNSIERVVSLGSTRKGIGGNYLVRIGTPVEEFLAQALPDRTFPAEDVLLIEGGPMMGHALQSPHQSIGKGTGGILLLSAVQKQKDNCIGCGYCVDVCPQKLMPLEFARPAVLADKRALEQYHVVDCIECAACAYVCPSDVPLLESILKGKELLRMQ